MERRLLEDINIRSTLLAQKGRNDSRGCNRRCPAWSRPGTATPHPAPASELPPRLAVGVAAGVRSAARRAGGAAGRPVA